MPWLSPFVVACLDETLLIRLLPVASSIHPTGNTRRRRQTERAARVGHAPLGSTAQAVAAALLAHAQHAPTTAAVEVTGPAAPGSAPAPV